MRKPSIIIPILLIAVFLTACMTYYQKTQKFQDMVSQGELEKAKTYLEKNDKDKDGKNKILYYMYLGWVDWMLGNYKESNQAFQTADLLTEDFEKKFGNEVLATFTNQGVKPYHPEDFENVMINYFKALNYLGLHQYNEAQVEARKIILKLQQLNDKYKENKNKYSDDAFAHIIIGLVYDANRDYNNAFIAYRNAYETYENIYKENFNVNAPLQLKKDLIRTAYLTGFKDDVRRYEEKFGLEYDPMTSTGGSLVFFWQNGLGPVKAEWSITFTQIKGEAGFVTFTNADLGITFPMYIGDRSDKEQNALRDLSIFRVAFPKYVERLPIFDKANISLDGKAYPLELAENINAIAFKTLHDRMLREMGNALLRVAVKRAMEEAARKLTEHENSGDIKLQDLAPAALTILNAATEKADTRNWQTLPFDIFYTRVPLSQGDNSILLKTSGNKGQSSSHTFNIDGIKGGTAFYTYQSLESNPVSSN
ncbi:COG3014 family protein [Bacteroidota bacterium]